MHARHSGLRGTDDRRRRVRAAGHQSGAGEETQSEKGDKRDIQFAQPEAANHPSSLFRWLAGLAVGLALKEQRYLADASDSPLDRCPLGPPFSAILWRRFSRRFGKISKHT